MCPLSTPPPGMVLIPAGTFTMGAADLAHSRRIREVFVSDFFLDTHLVTNCQFDRYVEDYRKTPFAILWNHPAGDVSLIARGKRKNPDPKMNLSSSLRDISPDLVSMILEEYGDNPSLFAPEVSAFRVFSDLCGEQGQDPFSVLIHLLREREAPFEVRRVVPETRKLKRNFVAPGKPAVNVTWHEAFGYAAAQRVDEKYCKRLPREAEWEKAGRGGKGYEYGTSTGEIGPKLAHYERNSTAVVGSYLPNPFGLYDMSGNAWEWCMDWKTYRYDLKETHDPKGPKKGQFKVRRGGAWNNQRREVRVATRLFVRPDTRGNVFGFRCGFGESATK